MNEVMYITLRIAEEVLQDKKHEGNFICPENQFYYAIRCFEGKTEVERFTDPKIAECWLVNR